MMDSCCAVNGVTNAWLRVRTRGLGPDFTDCRNSFRRIPAACSSCGKVRKIHREFVKDGTLSWQDWREQEGLPLHDDWEVKMISLKLFHQGIDGISAAWTLKSIDL